MTDRNKAPAHVWQALIRLRACNKQQLAAALGVNRHTLARWITATETGDDPGDNATERAADLLSATLCAAGIDTPRRRPQASRETDETP